MITRNGKIARLPKQVRDDLNDRLEDGAPGRQLASMLKDLNQDLAPSTRTNREPNATAIHRPHPTESN